MKTIILKILPILLLLIWAGTLRAQIGTTAGSVTSCPGEIAVPVNVTNCNGVGAISLQLIFDNTKLTYLGYQNLNSALGTGYLIISSTANRVVIGWANSSPANLGNSTMVELRFSAVASTTSLTWDTQNPGYCEYADVLGNLLAANFTNGTATIQQPPTISVQPVNRTVLVGQNTTFTVSASGTGLAYRWQISTNGGGIWTDLNDNATYSGVTGATLYLTNALLTYNGYKYRCRLTGTCPPVINTNEVTLTVINPITTTLPTASPCPGSIIVPVTVTNFTSVAAFSITFSYNTANLTYTGSQNMKSALTSGSYAINASGGKVYMTWTSATPVTFADGTIIEFLFTGTAGTSPLTWDVATPGNCEYSRLDGSAFTTVFTNGTETVLAQPQVTSQPSNRTIANGQNTTFGISASGAGLTYRWQLSTDGGNIFNDLSNGGVYSNVTNPTMNITGALLTMNGYQYRCRVTGTCTPVAFSNPGILTVLPNVITTCSSVTGCPGQVLIPIRVTDFTNVASFSMALNFSATGMTWTGYQKFHSGLTGGSVVVNASGGKVYFSWSKITPVTLPGGDTLVELKFTGNPGSGNLTWDTQTAGNCEYSDVSGQVIFSTWNNGSATINTPPSITAEPVNRTIYAGGSTTFSVTATGTGIGYLWQVSTNGGLNWTNLTNTSPYSGVYTGTMTINPAATGMNGYRYHCIVSGTCPPADTSSSALLTVTQQAITTFPNAVVNSCTGNVSVPINVTNCNNVGGISLTLTYDTTKLTYDGYTSVNPALSGGMMAVNRYRNRVMFTWASTSALNLGSGALFSYRFKASAAASTTIGWDTQTGGACEYSDPAGTIIASFYNTANVTVNTNPLVVNAGNDTVMQFSSVQLNGSATGGTSPYTWSWTPTGSLNNPAIPNPVASPTVTTTYTLVVTDHLGCSGSDAVTVTVGTVPDSLTLQNITVPSPVENCYNAQLVITVAGGGTFFNVENGGSAIMIAGKKIRYLAGTNVDPGGYLHGYISTSYCSTLPLSKTAITVEEMSPFVTEGSLFRVYPNPTTGWITVELRDENRDGQVYLAVYGSHGELIEGEEMTGLTRMAICLGDRPAGLYYIRVVSGNKGDTRKIIKL